MREASREEMILRIDKLEQENELLYAAHQELSRVDKRTFGMLMIEVTSLSSELAAAKAEIERLNTKYDYQLLAKRDAEQRAQIEELVNALIEVTDRRDTPENTCDFVMEALSKHKTKGSE